MVTSVTTGCLIKDVPKGIEKGVKSGLDFELLSYLGIKSEKFQQNLQKNAFIDQAEVWQTQWEIHKKQWYQI